MQKRAPMAKKFICLSVVGTVLAGCAQGGSNKADLGTALGGIIGAVAGSQVGDGSGRLAAIGLGALLGGIAGRAIGTILDEQDQRAMQQQAAVALDSAPDGRSITWQSNRTGASAVLTPSSTRKETRQMTIIRDKRVILSPGLELVGEPRIIKSNANVRSGPSTDHPVVNSATAGTSVGVVGRVQGSNWYLVSRDRVTIGYVHGMLLERDGQPDYKVAGVIDLDRVQLSDTQVTDTITTSTTCRTMTYDVKSATGNTGSDQFHACKAPDGTWELG